MLFYGTLTIPALTLKQSPATAVVKVDNGIITKFMIRPRPGHSDLAHLVITYHEHQIAPAIVDMNLHGDSFPIDWEDYIEVDTPPYEFKMVGWNEDDTYPHTFDMYVAILPKRGIIATAVVEAITNIASIFSPRRIFTGGG